MQQRLQTQVTPIPESGAKVFVNLFWSSYIERNGVLFKDIRGRACGSKGPSLFQQVNNRRKHPVCSLRWKPEDDYFWVSKGDLQTDGVRERRAGIVCFYAQTMPSNCSNIIHDLLFRLIKQL